MNTTRQDSFITIIKEHEALIHKVCGVYAAEPEDRKDLFQEIVMQAWTAFGRFANNAKVSTWLYRVALNTAISHLRKEKKHGKPAVSFENVNIPVPLYDNRNEEYNVMHQMIAALPTFDKALMLLYLDDKSHNEIAEILGITTTNVATRLMRIREKLKKQVTPLFK